MCGAGLVGFVAEAAASNVQLGLKFVEFVCVAVVFGGMNGVA